MGQFYTNHTLKGPSQREVAAALHGRAAFVSPTYGDCLVVYDQLSEDQDAEVISGLGELLSNRFQCPVLASLMHDDSVLMLFHFRSGELVDVYDSLPGYFDPDADGDFVPTGGDARQLCSDFDSGQYQHLERILRKSHFEDDSPDEHERHSLIAGCLGLPPWVAGIGYNSIDLGEPLEGLDRNSLLRME